MSDINNSKSDKKDEIIAMQLEVIRSMTESSLRRTGLDIWGSTPAQRKKDPPSDTSAQGGSAHSVPEKGIDGIKTPYKSNPEGDCVTGSEKTRDAASVQDAPKQPEPAESLDDLRAELDGYIGLSAVKEEVKSLINLASVYKMRREMNLPVADMSLHMVFSGNPGTGKTMIARFMARVYKSLGIISGGQLTEVDRSGLVAGFVGQTAIKTAKVIEKALGGVLFIDEAYTLTERDGNDFGQEAVDTLLKAMEDQRDELIVIVAGYTENMKEFVASNPGLRSRFNKYLNFEDYTPEEMAEIFKMNCRKSCYTLTPQAEEKLLSVLRDKSRSGDFGNARGVRNLFEKALTAQATRLAGSAEVTRESLMELREEDISD